MNFWQAQEKAKGRTKTYIFLFLLMVFAVTSLAEMALRLYAPREYNPPFPLFGIGMALVILFVALFQYLIFKKQGGGYVARQVGGRQIDQNSRDFLENRLYNITQEMAVASGMPMPEVYVIDRREINAFAAGLQKEKAAVAVTRGALELLNREELQGVVAHEFGHIYNEDMKISLRLSALLMGLFFLLTWGYRISFFTSRSRSNQKGGGTVILVAAFIFIIAGSIMAFFGSILRAMVSRQREYLADACAVQFTRSNTGIANALRKIEQKQVSDMPRSAAIYSHLYFDNRGFSHALFATHPPLKKRIEAIEGETYLPEEWKKNLK
ncbi:MAG: M48 family metallopeptidase [Waddliaceae bacterium]